MPIRRCVLASVVFALLAGAAVSFSPALAQQQKKDQKLEKIQQQELAAAYSIADQIAAGQMVAADISLSLRTDYLKAQNGLTFVPFVLSLDPAGLTSRSVTLYLRLVAKAPGTAASGSAAPDSRKGAAQSGAVKPGAAAGQTLPEYAFQGIHYVDLKAPAPGEPLRLSRAFSVPAGDYDLFIVVRERGQADAKRKATGPKVGFLRQVITVPDLWTSELTTSSVILADEVRPIEKPPTAEQLAEQPYTIGNSTVVPASGSRLTKARGLSVLFLVYNTGQDGSRKPDVVVEYLFYQRFADKTEKYFNKTNPQMFNAATLPAQFDIAAGHNVLANQFVSLASFSEGEYRLEIRITDKLSGRVVTRNISFSVAA